MERGQVGVDGVGRPDGVEDEVEASGLRAHLPVVGGQDHVVGTQRSGCGGLVRGPGELHGLGAEPMGQLQGDVTESSHAHDADRRAGTDPPAFHR